MVNADLTARAAIATDDMPWASCGDLLEKVLEDAPGRRTAIVRTAGAAPLAIRGTGCLDVLVLDGVGAGTYLHRPASGGLVTPGPCTLFVKERPSTSRVLVEIDTTRVAYAPQPTHGMYASVLHEDDSARVVLLYFAPGTVIGPHRHDLGEEFFVLTGSVTDELGTYALHAWVRQPPDSVHSIASPGGCLFLTFADHLA
jgi:hypothetical protein